MLEDDALDALLLESPETLRRADVVREAYAEISDLGLSDEEMRDLIAEEFGMSPAEVDRALAP